MRNLLRFALAVALCLVFTVPGTSRAQIRVGLYPPQGDEREVLRDLQSVLESALMTAQRRGVLSKPFLLPETCPAPATNACLAALGRGSAVLVARMSRKESGRLATLALIDSRSGRATKAVSIPFDPDFQDIRVVDRAIEILEGNWAQLLEQAPGAVSTQPPSQTTPAPEQEAAPAPLPPAVAGPGASPAAATLAQSATQEAVEEPTSRWMGRAAPWVAGAGALLLAGSAAAGFAGSRINERLTDAYRGGRLVPADKAAYTQVAVLNVVANSLLVAGGLATATGIGFWVLAPQAGPVAGGAQFGVSGRF